MRWLPHCKNGGTLRLFFSSPLASCSSLVRDDDLIVAFVLTLYLCPTVDASIGCTGDGGGIGALSPSEDIYLQSFEPQMNVRDVH